MNAESAHPAVVDRATFQAELDKLRLRRGVEAMDNSYALMDLTVYGRQEPWEDSPAGWPRHRSSLRSAGGAPDWPPVTAWPGGRPIAQWPRLAAGRSGDLGPARR